MYRGEYESPLGRMVMVGDEKGLAGLWFEGQRYFMRGVTGECDVEDDERVFGRVREWLGGYFAGRMPEVEVELRPRGTEFQMAVWGLLREIPYGETVTYGELAVRVAHGLGKARMSAQAVGGAVGRNPISLIVPCHRVMGARGELTGYGGGMERKEWLLRHEGVL